VKTNAGQTIAKIQSSAAQVWDALAIDKKFHPVAFYYSVAFLFFIERHLVLKPRTAALCDLHAQAFPRIFCARFKQSSKLSNSAVGDINHRSKNRAAAAPSQKLSLHQTPFFFAIWKLKSKIKSE
jgi:hypothetical protein